MDIKSAMKRSWGVIDYLNKKHFGFIREHDSNECYFFHGSALTKDSAPPLVGRWAIFTRTENFKGPVAINVRILSGDEPNVSEILSEAGFVLSGKEGSDGR